MTMRIVPFGWSRKSGQTKCDSCAAMGSQVCTSVWNRAIWLVHLGPGWHLVMVHLLEANRVVLWSINCGQIAWSTPRSESDQISRALNFRFRDEIAWSRWDSTGLEQPGDEVITRENNDYGLHFQSMGPKIPDLSKIIKLFFSTRLELVIPLFCMCDWQRKQPQNRECVRVWFSKRSKRKFQPCSWWNIIHGIDFAQRLKAKIESKPR